MAQTKTVQVRKEIRELAQAMELRMRAAAKMIANGDWRHHKLMSEADLIEGAERNLAQLKADLSAEKAMEAAADVANFCNFVRLRMAGTE